MLVMLPFSKTLTKLQKLRWPSCTRNSFSKYELVHNSIDYFSIIRGFPFGMEAPVFILGLCRRSSRSQRPLSAAVFITAVKGGSQVKLCNEQPCTESVHQIQVPSASKRVIKHIFTENIGVYLGTSGLTCCVFTVFVSVDGLVTALWSSRLEWLSKAWERNLPNKQHICSARR